MTDPTGETTGDPTGAPTVDRPGSGIVVAGWVANALFLVTAVPAAAGIDGMGSVSIAVALVLFFASIGAFVYAFVVAAARSARGDNIAVANLFFLQGSAPRVVQRNFGLLFAASTLIAAGTAVWAPFGVLVPMLPVGLAGVWAARHGAFGPRLPATRGGARS